MLTHRHFIPVYLASFVLLEIFLALCDNISERNCQQSILRSILPSLIFPPPLLGHPHRAANGRHFPIRVHFSWGPGTGTAVLRNRSQGSRILSTLSVIHHFILRTFVTLNGIKCSAHLEMVAQM